MSADISLDLVESVKRASHRDLPVCIQGGNTKAFYGRPPEGEVLQVAGHTGIVSYEPTELVITARCGTPLLEIESILGEKEQMLAFEPPGFGDTATLGGTIACGLSGPRRPYAGPARDFVLGVRMINGSGENLRFGGQVMKNVAGYDVSRLLTGSLGTLGVLLEVSLKVLPVPKAERTVAFEVDFDEAAELYSTWAGKSSPISATCHHGSRFYVRLSGSEKGVSGALQMLGGEEIEDGSRLWRDLKEHRHEFFRNEDVLWRISVPPATPRLNLSGDSLSEWGGALRWLRSDAPAETIRKAVESHGGHAVYFRGNQRDDVFHPLSSATLALHKKIKQSFDPGNIFNPGRMYEQI